MWMYLPIIVVVGLIYISSYILLRTAGDGRPAFQRLLHPSQGGTQEEYGGDGHGNVHPGYGEDARNQVEHRS